MDCFRSFYSLVLGLAVALALGLGASSAWAQAVDIPMIVTGGPEMNTWANASYAYQFETDIDSGIDGSNPEFSRHNVGILAGHRFELNEDLFLVGNAAYQGSYYNFDKGNGADTQLRWGDIHRMTLMAGLGWTSGDWTLIGLLLGRSDGESGASFDETLTGGGALMVEYRWTDSLRTGFILGAMSALEEDAGLIPLPTVDWAFADNWNFHFGVVSAAGYPGVGPEVSYRGEQWSFGVGGSYQRRRYRLDNRSANGATNQGKRVGQGIGTETSFPVYARAGYAPTKNMNFGVTAGVALGGTIRAGTRTDRLIFEEDYDPAPILGFNANFLF